MDDLISREAAIDVARKCSVKEVTPAYMLINKAEVMTELMMLPSIQPDGGTWIKMSDADGDYYVCDQCGEELPRYTAKSPTWDIPYPTKYSIDKTNFCPNCGAEMRGGK